jgi:hypothetical protein
MHLRRGTEYELEALEDGKRGAEALDVCTALEERPKYFLGLLRNLFALLK